MNGVPGEKFLSVGMRTNNKRLMNTWTFSSLLFAVIVDEDEPVVNQSIVQEVVEASQMSVSPEICRFA